MQKLHKNDPHAAKRRGLRVLSFNGMLRLQAQSFSLHADDGA